MKNNKKSKKVLEWLDRYLAPSIISIISSISLAMLLQAIFNNRIITALGGTWGDNLGFYGLILYKDIKERKQKDEKVSIVGLLKVLRNAIAEFGVGEYLDSFVIRPFLMYMAPQYISNKAIAITIAKLLADVTFFLPTIIMYEVRKRVFKD